MLFTTQIMDSHFEEIFQGWLDKEEYNKNKGFLKKTKNWKRYFCVLRRYDGDENVYFQWFEREEDWRKEFPKGSFGLFPKYSVFKRKMEKVKNVFEISNDDECHYFVAANEKTMDLWVIQLMMQTRLNASMIEHSFRVKGGEVKCLQRIGAKNLNCLLHVSEWGITLALERTHSVLSQWPLTTIRNYECTDNNEFVFEAGRKSPMGEGKYHFHTINGQDNEIFDKLDCYTSLRAEKVRLAAGGRSRRDSRDDDLEIAQAYGKLRWSVMLNNSTINLGVIPAMSSDPQTIHRNDNSMYNRLQRNNNFQSTSIDDSYDRLDRTDSFNERSSQTTDMSYSRLNCSNAPQQEKRNSRGGSTRSPPFNDCFGSPSRTNSRSRSFGSLEGRSQSQFSSPPPDDNYNHLSRYRHASWSSSHKGSSNGHESYDKLDRSTMSVQQGAGASVSSYDRLDNMQQNVFVGQDHAISPPRPPNITDSNGYDTFGNRKDYVPQTYNVHIPAAAQASPAVVALPPPLPQKPSFMMQAENNQYNPPIQNSHDNPNTTDPNLDETKNETPIPQATTSVEMPNTLPEPSCEGGMANVPSHYQELDDITETDFENAKPRHRLNTHSSDTDLRTLSSKESSTLDPSKRNTVHRSAPSLARYTIVKKEKSEKSSRKSLSKSGSTFTLDGFFKKIGRLSKKGADKNAEESAERSYEKVSKKSRKSQQKHEKTAREESDSSSSLRHLVNDDDASSTYAEIDDNVTSSGSIRIIEHSESKRPLPELPPHSSIDV